MQGMDQQQADQEEKEMLEANIKQFIEATREYLLGFVPSQEPALATVRICNER